MTERPVLSVRNLTTVFNSPWGELKAINDVSFDIRAGQVLGVLGESGSGKSVTALSIMRLLPQPPGRIASGSIGFDGEDIVKMSRAEVRRLRGYRMSMIFQEPMTSLNPVYTVGDQIAEVFRREGVSRDNSWKEAIEALNRVNIPSPAQRANDYPHQFSGGMRQRVMIAMAIAARPRLLIADEPTTALDVTIQAQILDLILRLAEEQRMAVLLITHDLGVVAETADRVVAMYAGQIVEEMSVDELFEAPCHPYTQGLMRSTPRLGRKFLEGKKPLEEIRGTVPPLHNLPPGCPFQPRCPAAHDRCAVNPPLFRVADGHGARCWLAEKDAQTYEGANTDG